jgi:hypothetical protein
MTSLDTALARFTPVEAAPITDAELQARIASLQVCRWVCPSASMGL